MLEECIDLPIAYDKITKLDSNKNNCSMYMPQSQSGEEVEHILKVLGLLQLFTLSCRKVSADLQRTKFTFLE